MRPSLSHTHTHTQSQTHTHSLTAAVLAARSPSPNSASRIPAPSSSRRSPPPRGTQNSTSRPPRGNPLDAVVLESAMSSLQLSENRQLSSKESSHKKVEDWLRHSSTAVATETPSLPGKQESMGRERMDGYRKNVQGRNVVKMAMI